MSILLGLRNMEEGTQRRRCLLFLSVKDFTLNSVATSTCFAKLFIYSSKRRFVTSLNGIGWCEKTSGDQIVNEFAVIASVTVAFVLQKFRRNVNIVRVIKLATNGLHPVKRNIAADKPALVLSNDSKNKILFSGCVGNFGDSGDKREDRLRGGDCISEGVFDTQNRVQQSISESQNRHVSSIVVNQVGISFGEGVNNVVVPFAQIIKTEFKDFADDEREDKSVIFFDDGANLFTYVGRKNDFRSGNGK